MNKTHKVQKAMIRLLHHYNIFFGHKDIIVRYCYCKQNDSILPVEVVESVVASVNMGNQKSVKFELQ